MSVKVAMAVVGMLAAGSAEAGVRVVVRGYRPAAVASPVIVRTPVLRVSAAGTVSLRPGHGRLHVEVDPERAKVYLDGRYLGRGDATRTLRAGRHVVRVVLADGREAVETVWIEAGRLTRARLDLNG